MLTNVLDYLDNSTALYPDKEVFSDSKNSVTYRTLHDLAESVGSAVADCVSTKNSPVVVFIDRNIESLISFMGIVMSGNFYVPVDRQLPVKRIELIIKTLMPKAAIISEKDNRILDEIQVDVTRLNYDDIIKYPVNRELLSKRRREAIDTDPLYAIFTSGSTGVPKGVLVCHRSVIDLIENFAETFGFTSDCVFGNQAPFDFDVCVKDIYSGLFTGATVQIIPTAYFTQPTKLMDFLCDRGATMLIWAVSALCFVTTMNALDYRKPDTLRAILFSGEVMPIKHLHKLQKHLPDVMYVNLYGPTEITCNCTYYIVDRAFEVGETLPIGVPFPNERILLLREDNTPAAPGEVGELCVSGTAVAMGYYKDPERTAAAFTQNPLNPAFLETIYRTGDLVRLAENGEMVYVSRKDFQIKHMGHRIELGEIETALCAVEGVERACCLYLHDKGKILCYTCGPAQKAQIVEALHVTLPAYMIPNLFRTIDAMPLNKNGKIDRNALMALYEKEKEARHG